MKLFVLEMNNFIRRYMCSSCRHWTVFRFDCYNESNREKNAFKFKVIKLIGQYNDYIFGVAMKCDTQARLINLFFQVCENGIPWWKYARKKLNVILVKFYQNELRIISWSIQWDRNWIIKRYHWTFIELNMQDCRFSSVNFIKKNRFILLMTFML